MNPLRAEFDAIIAEYRATLPQKIERLDKLLDAGSLAELRRELHTLAGSAGTFGLPRVGDAARAAEAYLEASGAGPELDGLLRKIAEQARAQ